MLEISTRKIARVVVRSRQIDAKVARWGGRGDSLDANGVLESRSGDRTEAELRQYIADLNSDEQASLVAVAWIGRGTFDASELEEAIRTAKEEASSPTEDYLIGMGLLSDYLEDGLDALGYSVEEVEEGIL